MTTFDKAALKNKAITAAENVVNQLPEWRQEEYTGHIDEPAHSSIYGLACEAIDEWYAENSKEPTIKELEDLIWEII